MIGLTCLGLSLLSGCGWSPDEAGTSSSYTVRVSSVTFTPRVEYPWGTVDVLAKITNVSSRAIQDIVVRVSSPQVERDWHAAGVSWQRGTGQYMVPTEDPLGQWHLGAVEARDWVRVVVALEPSRIGRVPFSVGLIDDRGKAIKGGWISGTVTVTPHPRYVCLRDGRCWPRHADARRASRSIHLRGLYHGAVAGLPITDKATGSVTLLGPSTLILRVQHFPFTNGSGCSVKNEQGTLTAANGTQIRLLEIDAGCRRDPIVSSGYFLIYDGTEKLFGARGGGTLRITGPDPQHLTYALEGTLTYCASVTKKDCGG